MLHAEISFHFASCKMVITKIKPSGGFELVFVHCVLTQSHHNVLKVIWFRLLFQ